jgi:hypothetical protein
MRDKQVAGSLLVVLLGLGVAVSHQNRDYRHMIKVWLELPNPPEGRFIIGVRNQDSDLCAQIESASISVQNPFWGHRFWEFRKWFRLAQVEGYDLHPSIANGFSVKIGYKVETFLELKVPEYIQSYRWGELFPPRIFFKPQPPIPLHIKLSVRSRMGTGHLTHTHSTTKHYLLSPDLCAGGDHDDPQLSGAVRKWRLQEANWMGQLWENP